MESTAKSSAHPLTNIAIALSPKVNIFSGSCFAKRRLTEACIFSRLSCTGSLRTLRERQFLLCFISALAIRPWRASRSNSVRRKDRLPLARGAVDPGQMTAGIETPSGSSSTTAARSASAALGFVTLIEIALVVPSLLVLASPAQPRIWHDGCRTRFIKLKRTRSQIKSLKLTETIRSKCWCRCIVCVLGACLAHVPSKH